MRKALYAVLWTGLFLLLLSTLVVTPEAASAADILPPSSAQFHAFTLPAAPEPTCGADHPSFVQSRVFASSVSQKMEWAADPGAQHDSNGRVLTSVRYENSVYQVFRPEVAGG